MNRQCGWSGENFRGTEEAYKRYFGGAKRGDRVPCPGCGKLVKLRGHPSSPMGLVMIPAHSKRVA